MIKAIIFNNDKEAMAWDYENNDLPKRPEDTTLYNWVRKTLAEEVTLTKAQYAEYLDIPAKINSYDEETEQVVEVTNPAYTALSAPYTVHKCGLVVGDDLDETDEEGNVTVPENVVDITELLLIQDEL